MNYVKNVQIQDKNKNLVNGIGVVNNDGNIIAICAVRSFVTKWKLSSTTANSSRNVGFGNIEVKSFKQEGSPDKDGFVSGKIGETIVHNTPMFIKQVKNPKGEIGVPFFNSILDYHYILNAGATKNSYPINMLIGDEITNLITEAINKGCEYAEEQDEAGKSVRQGNATYARAANSVMKMADRNEKKQETSTAAGIHEDISDIEAETIDADDIPLE